MTQRAVAPLRPRPAMGALTSRRGRPRPPPRAPPLRTTRWGEGGGFWGGGRGGIVKGKGADFEVKKGGFEVKKADWGVLGQIWG